MNAIDVDRCASGECELNSHSNRIKCERAFSLSGVLERTWQLSGHGGLGLRTVLTIDSHRLAKSLIHVISQELLNSFFVTRSAFSNLVNDCICSLPGSVNSVEHVQQSIMI